jgi:hypothetical protein
MDALERVLRIRPDLTPRDWSEPEFQRAKDDGYRRWRETREVLGIDYHLFGDAVAEVAPEFRLATDEERAVASVEVPHGGGNCPRRALVWFLKWERCLTTQGLPNPYEPWVAVWEHGGAVSVEHAQFVDVSFVEPGEDRQLRVRRV